MKIVCVIPARYKSSRFPGKPLADICGKPMIWYVYQQCMKVRAFDKVVVATDDERIKAACEDASMACLMTSDQHMTGTDRVAEVAANIPGDLYVNVQGDEPLVRLDVIHTVVEPFSLPGFDKQVTNLMAPIHDPVDLINTTVVKVVTKADGTGMFLSRAAIPYPKGNLSIQYYKQLGIYAFSRDALAFYRDYGKAHGKARIEKIEDVEMLRFIENGWDVQFISVNETSIAVDTPSDLERVRALIGQHNCENNRSE